MLSGVKFPTVTGNNLAGRTYHLPADFERDYNVLIIPFERWQQTAVNTWQPLIQKVLTAYPDVIFYELPTLPNYGAAQRRIIDDGMRYGIGNQAARNITITLYIDQRMFLKSLGLPTTDTIYALLVDRAGRVYWRVSGAFSEIAGAELMHTLAELLPTS